jgi:hypothetical protein
MPEHLGAIEHLAAKMRMAAADPPGLNLCSKDRLQLAAGRRLGIWGSLAPFTFIIL